MKKINLLFMLWSALVLLEVVNLVIRTAWHEIFTLCFLVVILTLSFYLLRSIHKRKAFVYENKRLSSLLEKKDAHVTWSMVPLANMLLFYLLFCGALVFAVVLTFYIKGQML